MKDDSGVYRSKKGAAIYIPTALLFIAFVASAVNGVNLGSVLTLIVISLVVLPMLLNTRYTIMPDAKLNIRCGWFINITMEVRSIKKIADTRNMLSSPALSLDRIEIFYNKFDSVMVSPENKASFIEELQTINPAIAYQRQTS